MQLIALVEKDTTGDKDASMDGKLKDVLPRMGRQARNDFFQGFLETEEMKKAQPVRPVLLLGCPICCGWCFGACKCPSSCWPQARCDAHH